MAYAIFQRWSPKRLKLGSILFPFGTLREQRHYANESLWELWYAKSRTGWSREERIRMEALVDAYGAEEQAMGWYY